jgi:hypothetical protein
VGVARVNITPDKPLWMAGYGARDRPAEGKLTDLWGKAIVLQDGDGDRAVLVTMDLVGMDRDLSQAICRDLEKEHALARHQIALCFSHTHTGPVVGKNLAPMHYSVVDAQQQKLIDEYAAQLKAGISRAVGEAIGDLKPCQLTWGSGTATFATNRRNNREGDVPALRAEGAIRGPSDHDVPVLAVRDGAGKLKAVVFGYACHSTVLSFQQWSGDYPGFAQADLEARHPGCLAFFWSGCGADQNPLPRRTVELAEHYGRRLALAVDSVLLTNRMSPVADVLTTRYREIDLPLDQLPTREEVERDSRSKERFVASRARNFLQQIDSGKPLSPTYPYPISAWRLGEEIQFIILGGEVVVDFALRLKAELSGTRTWVAGYSNDVMAYIPSRRVLDEGGYEGATAMVVYGLPTKWAPSVEERILQEVHAQLEKSK